MPVTIKDVAREANVSVATVSRALNGHANVTHALRGRIREVAARLRYMPHGAARSLITRRTQTLGAILPDLPGRLVTANATSTIGLWPGAATAAWAYRGERADLPAWARWLVVPSVAGAIVGTVRYSKETGKYAWCACCVLGYYYIPVALLTEENQYEELDESSEEIVEQITDDINRKGCFR